MKSKALVIFAVTVGVAAFACATRSTNLALSAYVSPRSNLLRSNGDRTASESQIALAKSGHTEELQQIYCELYDRRMGVMFEAGTVKLPQVGGWFAIKSYLQLFDADARFRKAKAGPPDLTYSLPSSWGLQFLPNIVANPPLQYNRQSLERNYTSQVELWKKYITSHEEELSKLEPTGAGIEFSAAACKNGKPRKKRGA